MSARIYSAHGIQTFFQRWQGRIDNPSVLVNTAIERYNYLLTRYTPEFSIEEWGVLFDAYTEIGTLPVTHLCSLKNALIKYIYRDCDITSRWEIDTEVLAEKINNLDDAHMVSMLDTIERYISTHSFEGAGYKFKSNVVQ